MRILLAIPAHNEAEIIGETLARTARKLAEIGGHEFDVVVADNASTDGTLAAAH